MEHTHYYNGGWHPGQTTAKLIESRNPATDELLWAGHAAQAAEIDAAMQSARKAFTAWARTSVEHRTDVLKRYQEQLKTAQARLAEAISDETGKQLWEARTEVATMIGKVDLSIAAYAARTGTSAKELNGIQATLTHRPHGVMLVLGPYNFPGHLPNGHIVPALLAGNCVVFKPSELTPLVGQIMVECLVAAGLPDGTVNLIQGDGTTGALLGEHKGYDGLLFTGSSRTGAALHQQLAGQPQRILALEMGGNNPLVFHQVNDLRAAVFHTLQSAYITSGQRCTCARRLIVVRDAQGEAFVTALQQAISALQVGLPGDGDAFYGPVISNQVADMLLAAQQALIERGAKPLVKMQRLHPTAPLLSPALLDSTAIEDREDEEFFGPLLQLFWVDDFDSAIKLANDTRFGLAAGLLSDNDELWEEFQLSARAGIVNRNRPTTGASGGAPFGGIGASGNHRPSAYYAADYCAYPMASMSEATATLPENLGPGVSL